ncbi:MAG: hypothetical protein Kow0080_29860 [Candidatus Promineifilaceae bacterium]
MRKRIVLFLLVMLFLAACGGADEAEEATPVPPTSTPTEATVVPEPAEATAVPATNEPAMLAPDGTPRETYFAPFPVAITLDGDLSDWDGVPRVTIPESALQVTGATAVTFAAAADSEYLYLLADVTDAKIVTGEHGTDYWNEDSVEFYINATGDLSLTSYEDGVVQMTIPPLNIGRDPEDPILGGVNGQMAGARVKVVETENGYAVETAVPLQNDIWTIQPAHGNVIGFQVHLNGASESSRNLKAIWSVYDTADSSYFDPSVFGQLIFFEVGQTEAAINLPQPETAPERPAIPADAPYLNPDLPVAERVEDLLARMTLEEKIGQMTLIEKNSMRPDDITKYGIGGLLSGGGGSPEVNTAEGWAEMVDGFQSYALDTYLGIPLIYGVDAVHGHGNLYGATIFPHNIGLGAANNPELMTEIGRATALEMIATGIYWNYAPGVMVPQDIRWGRTYEGYSENTDIVSALAAAYVHGLQGDDLAAPDTVLATPKHYVGDGGTAWGSSTTGSYQIDQGVTEVDEETLRAVHLPPYQAVIEAGARSIMISYSSWGGMKMHAQRYLIMDVLRGELGFDGFIVSDWGGVDQISGNYYEAVVTAVNAGIDMNMVPYDYKRFIKTVTEAVENGDISQERIDDAVRHILTVKFELGLFEHPFSNPEMLPTVGSEEHRALAREAVAQSLVLLKNEGDVLPLSPDLPLLLVGGEAADDIGIQSGGWTIEWQGKTGDITPGTTILEGIQQTVSPGTTVLYNEHGRFDEIPSGQPVVCLAVVGERPYAEGMGDSRDLKLPVNDLRMVNRMREVCDTLAVVLISGRPVIITDLLPDWDALVAAWLPGTEGQGVVDGLFGERPFTGKLPYTWPRSADDLPDVADPLFPFGFGLE